MEKDKEQTAVVFRVWKKKAFPEVLALFPYDQYSEETSYYCWSYAHIGQHGPANYSWIISQSRPATTEEYQDLFTELEGLGYNLRVIKKRGKR